MSRPETYLLLDLGNTGIKVGVGDREGVTASWVLPTDREADEEGWMARISELLEIEAVEPRQVRASALCSVVPMVEAPLRRALEVLLPKPPLAAPGDLNTGLSSAYETPEELGPDRFMAAAGARGLFEDNSLVVVDFGTATTIDCVQGGLYLGGFICPGVETSLRGLREAAAKLGGISLKPEGGMEEGPEGLEPGRTTAQSVSRGFLHGFAAMVQNMVERLHPFFGEKPLLVAAGGYAKLVSPLCPAIAEVRQDLVLEGIRASLVRTLS